MSLIPRLSFTLKPYQWQFTAMENAETANEYALLAEVGAGKTGALINILRLKYGREGRIMRTVIFTPLITLYNWQDEFKLHSKISSDLVLPLSKASNRNKKFEKFIAKNDGGIIIVNYEAVLNAKFMELVDSWCPEVFVCDEMHYIKNHKSKRSKAIVKLAEKHSRFRFGMTGTPILNSPMDIFMQWRFLDLGESFGTNFFRFRARYFQDSNAAWSGKANHFPKFEFIPSMAGEFHEKIYQKAIRVTRDECLDLPPLIIKTVKVPLSKEQQKHYDTMKRDFIAFIESESDGKTKAVVAQIALTKALRLQQICCGYMTTEEGEEVNMKDVPRLKVVEELLEQITPENKVILWCSFKNNYKQLGQICEKLKVKHGFITGDMTLDQKKETMDSLKNDPEFKVVIANRRAGGIGINLIEAKYSIVYSRNFSLGEEIQSEARNYRGGSQIHDRIIKIDLCAPDTIDETVLQALKSKQDVSDKIIDLKI